MKGFSILDKKGNIKEEYLLTENLKKYLSLEEFKKLAYELTPILRRRKKDLKIHSFTLNSGSVLQVGFRYLHNSKYEIFLIAHIPLHMKSIFNIPSIKHKS